MTKHIVIGISGLSSGPETSGLMQATKRVCKQLNIPLIFPFSEEFMDSSTFTIKESTELLLELIHQYIKDDYSISLVSTSMGSWVTFRALLQLTPEELQFIRKNISIHPCFDLPDLLLKLARYIKPSFLVKLLPRKGFPFYAPYNRASKRLFWVNPALVAELLQKKYLATHNLQESTKLAERSVVVILKWGILSLPRILDSRRICKQLGIKPLLKYRAFLDDKQLEQALHE
ncbi:MAG: hypothetical protein OXR68_00305 [Alphaproteobacteria bacterium]|nr:hypothetical protein [Alphaproteobacteria bacterium]MDD9919053.1 hypothetical protein [Alphaproteobacteria bacterium]